MIGCSVFVASTDERIVFGGSCPIRNIGRVAIAEICVRTTIKSFTTATVESERIGNIPFIQSEGHAALCYLNSTDLEAFVATTSNCVHPNLALHWESINIFEGNVPTPKIFIYSPPCVRGGVLVATSRKGALIEIRVEKAG